MGKGKINLEVSFKSVELSYRQNMKLNKMKMKKHSTPMVYCKTAPPHLDLKYFNKCFIKYLPFISRTLNVPGHKKYI